MQSTTRSLHQILRNFGNEIKVYRCVSGELDVETGIQPVISLTYFYCDAVVFDRVVKRNVIYDISYVKANSNFVMGGVYQDNTRSIIVDPCEFPRDYTLEMSDYIEYNGKTYGIKSIEEVDSGEALHIVVESTDNERRPRIVHEICKTGVGVTQNVLASRF